jgi:hypothetical protein
MEFARNDSKDAEPFVRNNAAPYNKISRIIDYDDIQQIIENEKRNASSNTMTHFTASLPINGVYNL